ncbi:(d)CMP kinase [Effusibacillus dendaii]|uniref:Cytidylate kinase n=1 Tax=Effusibacillus dendaii TaxID=2743772 RepID=A0A7I8D7J2_9BACL|nr:(d)CMP kinase [Effusibacillus dendaii]BCJ85362.1 cytidylate kinase [Effusibacillus dendaii]
MNRMKVAIDGPAGAGKSTVAKIVAERLGLLYIDTGAMYRAVALKAIQAGIDLSDQESLTRLAADLDIRLNPDGRQLRVVVNNQDVTDQIRSQQVTESVSQIATIPGVRAQLVKIQRRIAQTQGVVMDGRDIGTQVLPNAEVKIFLTASLQERAERRMQELAAKGEPVNLEELKNSIAKRDARDSQREFSPLCKAEDAHVIDSTSLSVSQVAEQIVELCKAHIGTNLQGEE